MPRCVATLLLVVVTTFSGLGASGQQSTAIVPTTFGGPISGSSNIQGLGTVQWAYHFDHNALKDAERSDREIVALTESGNLARFNAETLSITGHQVIPGRGTAIAQGKTGTLLIGAEDGQIFQVVPTTLELTPVTKAGGRIVWLTRGTVAGRPDSIVAVVDSRADVMPWPGEGFKAYETRSARIQRRVLNPLKVLIVSDGASRYIPFEQGSFATPSAFMLDDSDRLWMGTDKGEWGGEYSYMELRTGKVTKFDTNSGVLGFIKARDGRVLAYGGTSHMGMQSGFVADAGKNPAVYLREFTNWRTTELPEAAKRVLEKAKANRPQAAESSPRGPIDLMVEQDGIAGFWVLSEHDVYRCDGDFANWKKVGDLGGRWSGGRNYSVGNTPTIRRVLVTGSETPDLIAVSGRDGLARVSKGNVQHVHVQGQIESSIIEIWPTSIGVVYLNDDDSHTGWRLDEGQWQRIRFFPEASPSDENTVWNFAQPIMDDDGIVAYFGASVTPGERGFLKVGNDLKPTVLQTWKDNSSFYGSTILGTSDGVMLEVSEIGLRRWNGTRWEAAGSSANSGSDTDRKRLLNGRSYIRLMSERTSEVFLDAELGDMLRLTKSEKGYDLRRLTTSKGAAPGGIFDATADREGLLLLATSSGLVRFNPVNGERQAIAAPNTKEEFKSIVRDGAGRLWAAGDLLYVSVDEGKHWSLVQLPMLGPTYTKRVRQVRPDTLAIAIHDRGVVLLKATELSNR